MNVPYWAAELAGVFWNAAGFREGFPRDLRKAVRRGWPISVLLEPGLRLETVRRWIEANKVGFACPLADRRLRGCLLANRGSGYVFLDLSDPEEELRLSLAHEVAHFLRHYWQPRETARRKLGESILEVLDARRPPTFEERLHAILGEVPIGFHLHLLAQEPGGGAHESGIATAEEEADRLAYELLAPAEEVSARAGRPEGESGRQAVETMLRGEFGLPSLHAEKYARLLVPAAEEDSFLSRLRIV